MEKLNVLGETSYRLLIHNLLTTLQHETKTKNEAEKTFAVKAYRRIEEQIESVYNQQIQLEGLITHIHIVFSLSDAGSLKVTLSKLGIRSKCRILAFNDLFSVGPIVDLTTTEGQLQRQLWWMEHDSDQYYGNLLNRDNQIEKLMRTLRQIPEDKSIIIWYADNAHDQIGLRFALYLLKDRKNPVHAVNVSEMYKKVTKETEEGATPYAQALISKENYIEIVKSYGEGYPLDPHQRRGYESEWLKLIDQHHILRFWEDGKIHGQAEHVIDATIIKSVTELQNKILPEEFVSAGAVVNSVLHHLQQNIGYSFVVFRIWRLVSDGFLIFRGLPGPLHNFSIRLSN
ncbi:DUF1835 domain-containing protein [Paenibacillus illinoisensis]|uniref:DUF1835 domain-containing protein n=1 Tax=Paenibacillus illinoisensis TaxID=59845 RepID=UPI00301AE4DD